MNIKKTGKFAVLVAAATALVATLVNDKKRKEESLNKDDNE
ncbi:hypothetical protein ACFO6R_15815 [Eubacterium multiforme]|uniref:Uncharacterized protein n=1 Tax=Eubacterium multiforme TaxID=83339 RepID=A0ABT9UTM7_9FIRM|nr:hypothetical protein [Eubacterium multiforme]MDQ0149676.1 hypothetical protein [Eubacterium multiforme]